MMILEPCSPGHGGMKFSSAAQLSMLTLVNIGAKMPGSSRLHHRHLQAVVSCRSQERQELVLHAVQLLLPLYPARPNETSTP